MMAVEQNPAYEPVAFLRLTLTRNAKRVQRYALRVKR